jgi:uncharacterized protein
VIVAALLGALAGVTAGLLGTGGGALFVPALALFAGLAHVEAEATSLAAIVPMALLGSWRQHRYGNLRPSTALQLGVLAAPGAIAGVVLANAVPERALEVAFAGVLVLAALQLLRRP